MKSFGSSSMLSAAGLSSSNLRELQGQQTSEDPDATVIGPNEDPTDFANELYLLGNLNENDLRSNWRLYTSFKPSDKDSDENLDARRLENRAWRLAAILERKKASGAGAVESSLGDTDNRVSSAGKTDQVERFKHIRSKELQFSADKLLRLCIDHGLSNSALDDLLSLLRNPRFSNSILPKSGKELRDLELFLEEKGSFEKRPVCALFTHSLERNGANNFCLFLVQRLLRNQPFIIFAPKEGPMRQDFESLGLKVIIVSPKKQDYLNNLKRVLLGHKVGVILANTIMKCDVVLLGKEMNLLTVWMIHESWPKDKVEYYAQEVFLRKEITASKIIAGFAAAKCVIFPSKMQMDIYSGWYAPEAAKTIYNGIPLDRLDKYIMSHVREEERRVLGYSSIDILILHIGTICGRKGQLYTAKACAPLMKANPNIKCLFVGARYIRDHEIEYIDKIKSEISNNGLDWSRYEETAVENRGKARFTFMDIQSDVLRFYMSADVVVVASLNEVLPLVICEAMAFKKPVVASRIDAIPEAITNGVEGFLVPPANASALADGIQKLLKSQSLREKMGEAGRKRVEKQFSYSVMCSQWRETMDLSLKQTLPVGDLVGKTVLVDMDNTLVDWDAEFIRRYSAETGISQTEIEKKIRGRDHFEIEKNFPKEERDKVLGVVRQPGFYKNLLPFEGACEALKEMLEAGVDVRIVTSPHPTCPDSCAAEKYQFLEKFLGKEWIDRLVIARDKTYMYGSLLVDDKPKVVGKSPIVHWTQVLFTQPYNKGNTSMPRLSKWSDWRESLGRALNLTKLD